MRGLRGAAAVSVLAAAIGALAWLHAAHPGPAGEPCEADRAVTAPPVPTRSAAGPPETFRGDAGMTGGFSAPPVRVPRGELWRTPALVAPQRAFTAAGSAVLITDDRGLCSVDAGSGRLRWAWHGSRALGAPAAASGRVFVPDALAPELTALNLSDGRVLWRRPTMPRNQAAAVSFPAAAVIAGTTVFVTDPDGVLAVDAASGATRWEAPMRGATQGLSADPTTVFAVDGAGLLRALSATDGSLLWQQQVGTAAELPVVAGATVLASSTDLVVLDAGTGRVRWRGSPVPGITGVALAGGIAYVATSAGQLAAVDPLNGHPLWEFVPKDRPGFSVGPSIAGDVAYVGDRGGNLYAVDTGTHQLLWRYQADLRPGERNVNGLPPMTARREFAGGPLVVAEGAVLVSDIGGTVYAVG